MPLDPEMPIPLMLEQLRGVTAWQFIVQRLEEKVRKLNDQLCNLPPDTDAREVQRIIGEMRGIRHVLNEPAQLDKEWKRARQASPTTRATR